MAGPTGHRQGRHHVVVGVVVRYQDVAGPTGQREVSMVIDDGLGSQRNATGELQLQMGPD